YFPTEHVQFLHPTVKSKGEDWNFYNPGAFYPAQIGEVYGDRYQFLGKLGYGGHSIIWLAYQRLKAIATAHQRPSHIREPSDYFTIPTTHGEHLCLVHEPLGISIETFRDSLPERKLSEPFLKAILKHLLLALEVLHTEPKIIHTDLQARNLQLRIQGLFVLQDFERNELAHPSPRKLVQGHLTYKSRGLRQDQNPGTPVLCDFGEARCGLEEYTGFIQPPVYRGPEPLLKTS
ncbi:hypothetical protein D0864_05389, partial [Hortaea werneckii]